MGKLIDYLDPNMKRAVENVREAVERIWAIPQHTNYTDHTVKHSERIIALLDGLTTGMMATDKRLSNTEIYILLAAAYLHDIGMQNARFAGGNLDEIRAHHHEQTYEMIQRVFDDPQNAFPIPLVSDPSIVNAVALVAKGHREENLQSAEYDKRIFNNEKIHIRLLAALLSLGDGLDIDHRRVDIDIMQTLMNVPLDSQLHWWKCYYVNGVLIDANETIQIAYRFPPRKINDYDRLIKPLVENGIRAQLALLEEIFRPVAVKVTLAHSKTYSTPGVRTLPRTVEDLAWKTITPGVPVQQEFWRNFAVILAFSKVVHKAFQMLDFAYGNKLLDQVENIVRHPISEPLLSEFTKTWQSFCQYYKGFTEQELFEPAEKIEKLIKKVDDSFQYLRDSVTNIGANIETSVRAINDSINFFKEIKEKLADYPELMKDIEDIVHGPRVGNFSKVDRASLRQTLVGEFNDSDLQQLCLTFKDKVEYAKLSGKTKATKVRALITSCNDYEQLSELINATYNQQPDKVKLDWLNTDYSTQLTTRTREFIHMTQTLALQADSLIQNMVEIIVQKEGDQHE